VLTRFVRRAEWVELGDGHLRFEIEASSFCHQMVRSVVGTMVDMGLGRRRAGDMATVIRARDRQRAGQPAPPHGLCLWHVSYPAWAAVGETPPDG
jgi:tRNA pseudouridine38-40 synthase